MKQNFLTVVQAARRKDVSRTAIYRAIKSKDLRAREMLGRIVVAESDLLAWDVQRGWPKGEPVSQTTRKRISESQKQRWAKKKKQDG
jgi:hypothetical protein